MAWLCTSPPGVPKGMTSSPLTSMAGLGVRRGRRPARAPAGMGGIGVVTGCRARDGVRPVPGTTGMSQVPSLGVAEKALPKRSTTAT